jgi:hypothetical protein
VGSVVVAVDVGAARGAGLVEGLEFLAPHAALLELCEPGLHERLAFGIAVATAAMADGALDQARPECAACERGPVVGPERQGPGGHVAGGERGVDDRARLGATAADVDRPADDLARAAVDRGVQIAPAVLGDPDASRVQVPELVGAGDLAPGRNRAVQIRA